MTELTMELCQWLLRQNLLCMSAIIMTEHVNEYNYNDRTYYENMSNDFDDTISYGSVSSMIMATQQSNFLWKYVDDYGDITGTYYGNMSIILEGMRTPKEASTPTSYVSGWRGGCQFKILSPWWRAYWRTGIYKSNSKNRLRSKYFDVYFGEG